MKTAVVICPGRGTYNAGELGYLGRHFPDPALLARFDALRADAGQQTLSSLDGAGAWKGSVHARGDNASGLIFAASLGDVMAIDGEAVEVVAVTGNSMGWYTTLAAAGALSPEAGFRVANTMGRLMHDAMIGGQGLHPWMGEDWMPDLSRRDALLSLVDDIGAREGHALTVSIDLGGYMVVAGDATGLAAFEAEVTPAGDRYPMRLRGHAGFHSRLQAPVAARGQAELSNVTPRQPRLPMIDGRGAIWWPGASDPGALMAYTLGHQVTETYDFTAAIRVAAREFAPDLFIVAGPGDTLGGAVAQALILSGWRGMGSKADFRAEQEARGLMVAMGRPEQRGAVTRTAQAGA